MIHHLRHHTCPSLSFKKQNPPLKSPRFSCGEASRSVSYARCLLLPDCHPVLVVTVHYITVQCLYTLRNLSMISLHPPNKDSSVGKEQRLIRLIPSSSTHLEEKLDPAGQSGQTKFLRTFLVNRALDASDLLPAPIATARSQLGAP